MPFKKGVTPPGAKPFVKGQSGNPKGKPKGVPHLKTLLTAALTKEKDGVTLAQGIVNAIAVKALKGDVKAAELLLDRAYGKSPQTIMLEDESAPKFDPSKLTDEELRTYAALQRKCRVG